MIECLTHQTTHKTTARNYKRSKTGMPLNLAELSLHAALRHSCGRDLQSQAAKKLIKASKLSRAKFACRSGGHQSSMQSIEDQP